ncbi:Ca2+-binding protein, RTX toxin-related [Fibrobacter sp. UWH4]|nr:Ca2+-binding protein, RTX toxin-related [Fibrobacter sp. UWH4]
MLSKVDTDETLPDFSVVGSFVGGQNITPKYEKAYNVDLNFALDNANGLLDNNLTLNSPSDLCLNGVGISSLSNASWGVNDTLLSQIKHVQMGDVLNTLNDMLHDLSMAALKNDDLLKNDVLDGMLDQKSTSLINFSTMFDPIIKYPPKSMQELMNRLQELSNIWNTGCGVPLTPIHATISESNGDYTLNIPFLIFSGNTSKVSLSNYFLKQIVNGKNSTYLDKIGLSVVDKNALDYENSSLLCFNMDIALTNQGRLIIEKDSTLKNILNYDSSKSETLSQLGKSYAVVATRAIAEEIDVEISEDIEILLSDGKKSQNVSIKKGVVDNSSISQDILTGLSLKDSAASVYHNSGCCLFEISPTISVDINVVSGKSQEIGVLGKRSFEKSYLFNLIAGSSLTIDGNTYTVEKYKERDFVSLIGGTLSNKSGFKVSFVEPDGLAPILLIQNELDDFSTFGGGKLCRTLILYRNEQNHVVEKNELANPFTLTFEMSSSVVDAYSTTSTKVKTFVLNFEPEDFAACNTGDDVARVVNEKLSRYVLVASSGKQAVVAEIVHEENLSTKTTLQKIVFRCSGPSFKVTASEDTLGFAKNTAVNSSSDSIRLDIDGSIYDVSLYDSLNDALDDGAGNDLTIENLVKIIQKKIKQKYSKDVDIDSTGTSFKKLKKIEGLNGFTLVDALGLNDGVDSSTSETERQKIVKPLVAISNVTLLMSDTIKPSALSAHANMGMLGIDFTGKVHFEAGYKKTASSWNDFLTSKQKIWSYNSLSNNDLNANLSSGMTGTVVSANLFSFDNISNEWLFSPNIIDGSVKNYYSSFSNLQMSDVVLSVSDKLTDFLTNKIVDNEFLKKNIPLLGKSATDVLGIYAKVSELISELQRNTPATLQELSARLEKSLGAKLAFSIERTGIKVSFDWTKDVGGNKVAIGSLALGSDKVYVGGNAEAYLNGNVHVILDMIVKPSRNAGGSLLDVEIKDTSSVDFKVYMKGNPLKFDLSVSGGGLSASLLKVVSTNDNPSYLNMMAHMNLKFNLKDDKFVLDNTTDFRIGGELHVECAGLNVGSVKLGVYGDDSSTIECWDGNESNQSGTFDIARLTDINVVCDKLGLKSDSAKEKKGNLVLNLNTANIDFEKFSFFQKLRLVADGLSSVLRKAQLGVSKTFVSESIRKIPMVGDAIVAGADCLSELDSKFIEPFRKYVYGDHELDAGVVAEYLYDMLSNANLLKNLDKCSESSKIAWAGSVFDKYFTRDENNGVVQYNYDAQKGCAEWHVCIGGEYTLNANGDFDIGFSGLGLRGEGGVETKFEWKWNIGFGISKTEGAYILLSNGTDVDDSSKKIKADGFKVKANQDSDSDDKTSNDVDRYEMTGDDIELTLTITPTAIANASLGFLNADVKVLSNAQTLRLGVDLNDGKNGSDSLVDDKRTDKGKDSKIKISDLGKALSVEANLTGNVDFEAKLTLGLDLSSTGVSIGFPELGANFEMKWSAEYGNIAGKLNSLGFNSIYLDAGSFADRVLGPMLEKIKKVVEPLQPLIDFLQMEIPVINKLPVGAKHIKMLDIVKSFAKGKVDLGFLDDVVQIGNLISSYKNLNLKKLDLGSLELVGASVDFTKELNGLIDFNVGSISLKPGSDPTANAADEAHNVSETEKLFGKNNGTYGWAFPIIQSPAEQVIKLLLGQHADLVTYRMQPLVFETQWGKNFPIVGPLCADIGFNFGADIQLAFGCDTLGFGKWKDSHFKDFWALMDGFYINDYDENGVDIAEVIFHSGITAGASVGGIAGINVGVDLDLNLNFDDPNNDGKIRLQELARNLSLNPLTIFDASVTMEIEAFAYINYFIGSEKFNLWKSGAIELFNTDRGDADEPVLTTEQNGDVYINIGDYAAKRNKGDLSDNADSVTIKVKSATSFDVTYNGKTQSVTIGENRSLYIYAGEHNDVIKFETENSAVAKFNIIIDGGTGNDEIDLSKVTLNDSCIAVVIGGLGADIIYGASGRNFLFGETVLPLQYKKDDQEKIGDVLCAESYPDDGSAEINKIVANGTKKNVIFGGAGGDIIVGGLGADVIFGDGGRYINGIADRYDIFENGGDDIIYGRSGEDYIMGGAGDDTICGGNDRDFIFGGLGKDLISGGAGDDEIDAGEGVDVVFGDALPQGINDLIKKTFRTGYIPETLRTGLSFNSVSIAPQNISSFSYTEAAVSQFGNDVIYGGDGSDVIFGDNGQNNGDNGGNDRIYGGSGNDLIDGDAGNDYVDGGIGEDVIYGGQGDDTLDGGADNDIVFGDDGFNGKNGKETSDLFVGKPSDDNQNKTFGQSISKFAREFDYTAFTKAVDKGGNDIIMAGNGSDIVDGQSGEDTYKVKMMDNGNLAYTNVMDSGENDKQDSMIIDGTVNADDFLIRASTENLGFVAKLPSQKDAQIQRVNFWKKDDAYYGIENISLNAGAGNDNIAIDGTLSTISIDAGAGNDYITVGQMFNSVRESGDVNSNVLPKDSFETTKNAKGYLSNGVEHSTSIVGGEGNDTFNLLHNTAAISLAGGAGKDTFNVALFQEVHDDGTKSIIENGPVTLIGGADTDKMSIIGSDGDDTFVLSQGKVLGNGIDILSVSIENKNVYGGDGDDSFYVLDSVENEVTKLYGNKGNDSFYNGGAGTAEVPDITANSKNSDPNAIGVDFYSADGKNKLELAKSTLDEDGVSKTVYKIKLDKAPKAGEIVSVTIFAPGETSEALERGDRGIWLAYNNADGVECYCKSITYKFAASADNSNNVLAWNSLADVKLVAFGDSVREGDDYFSLLHNVTIESTATDATGDNTLSNLKDCKNALIFFNELDNSNGFTNQFSVTDEYLLTSTDVAQKSLTCYLKALPEEKDIVAWLVHDGSPVTIPVSDLTRNQSNNALTVNCETMPINGVDESGNPVVSTACWPVGTKFYFNYKSDAVYVEESSVVQMANSTDGMTAHLIYVPFDKSIGQYDDENACVIVPKTQRNNAGNYSYYYETAGTQIIICSVSTGKPIQINGNLYLAWTEHENSTSVTIKDELDSYKESSTQNIKDRLTDDTIADIKGPMYEDGAGKEASLGDHDLLMIHYGEIPDYTEGSDDEQNGISDVDKAARKAAEEEAAKFDEGNSKDRIFVNNRNNTKAGVQNDLNALNDVATFDNILIAKDVDSASVLQKTEDVVKQADTEWRDSDKHSLRLDHKDAGASVTNQFNLGNMEYAEINLGQGVDRVDVHKTVYREDGFQTFTVVNSGKGGDTVNVHSYAEEKSDKIATLKNLSATNYNGSIKNVVAYNVSGLTFCEGKSAATLTSVKNANATAEKNGLIDRNRVFLNVEFSDGTLQRREIVLDAYDITKMLLLKRALTPVALGVSIVSMYLANGYTGDGLLVVNAQSGNDTINAMGDNDADGKSKVTREGMVVIGGTGNDTLKVNTNVIAFGDRGQVIYENEKGEVVTRLGSLDVDSSITKDDVLDQYDYTTPSAKTQKVNGKDVPVTNYYQTDGVVRDPKYIHSVSEKVGGTDTIIANGDRNVVLGGAGADTISLNGSDNVAVGDNGEVKFANSVVVKNASGDVVNHVYGDSTKTYLNYVQSTFDADGDTDTITTKDGKNVVIGGTASDRIATGNGNDIIVGDGGEAYVDRNREALLVSNQGRNLDGNSAGSDVIKTSGGDNVILGGLNSQSRDFDFVKNEQSGEWETTSVDENNEDLIVAGSGKDVVFGDNAYASFRGNYKMVEEKLNTKLPTFQTGNSSEEKNISDTSILSFNFTGDSDKKITPEMEAGVESAKNWNNISGLLSGTYGNNDNEIVRFDDGTRASAISVSYGGHENHRNTSTDSRINLQGYNHWLNGDDGNTILMNSGLMSTAPNQQCGSLLEVSVDGLAQYYESYDVIVYLDIPDSHSSANESVRKITLSTEDGKFTKSYYIDDRAGKTFSGSLVKGNNETVQGAINAVKSDDKNVVQNYVVFKVGKQFAADRIIITVEDGLHPYSYNGKDLPGIAGLQIRGDLHKQDVAVSTDIDYGGNDVVDTNGGDDIVVGGTGKDVIVTYGDERYSIDDNDVVYGDNAKLLFADRDNNPDTATTLTKAESIVASNLAATYDDAIRTGDGNDVVVGGIGNDVIFSGDVKVDDGTEETAGRFEAVKDNDANKNTDKVKLDNLDILSFNFTANNSGDDARVAHGVAAGVVVDDDWHDFYRNDRGVLMCDDTKAGWTQNLYEEEVNAIANNHAFNTFATVDGVNVDLYGRSEQNNNPLGLSAYTQKNVAELDGDTANSKIFNFSLALHSQEEIVLKLSGLNNYLARKESGETKGDQKTYDVYVYLGGDNDNSDTYNFVYDVFSDSYGDYAGEHRYVNDWVGHFFDGDYREATCTDADKARVVAENGVTPRVEMIGNYVVFRGVTGDKFTVHIKNYHIPGSDQWPKNLPVITAVQIVTGKGRFELNEDGNPKTNNDGEKVRANVAIGGDHDKDLVYGDDAYLEFDFDIPYGVGEHINDFQNRVVSANSMAIKHDDAVKVDTRDIIYTGKDRDVVVGGEDADTIKTGAADDVVVGDNANLMMEHNNPIGVFTPSNEITLDDHTIDTSTKEDYLGHDNVTVETIQRKYDPNWGNQNNGYWGWGQYGWGWYSNNNSARGSIEGIKEPVDTENTGRMDNIVDNEGSNLLIEGQTSSDVLYDPSAFENQDDNGDNHGDDNQPVNDNEQPVDDSQPEEELTQDDGVIRQIVLDKKDQGRDISIEAGETIMLVLTDWLEGNPWYQPNVLLQVDLLNGDNLNHSLLVSWNDHAELVTFTENCKNIDIPDSANVDGEHKIVLLVSSEEDLNFKATVTNS